MRSAFFLFWIPIIVAFASCNKAANNPNYVPIPDNGVYNLKSGTIIITTPDTVITYDAAKDTMNLYLDNRIAPTYVTVFCTGSNTKFFQLDFRNTFSTSNSSVDIVYLSSSSIRKTAIYTYYNYATTNIGTLAISNYNDLSNGLALSGSFTGAVGRFGVPKGARLNTTNYTLSGTFNLKLTAK